jgi:hypothetical protein
VRAVGSLLPAGLALLLLAAHFFRAGYVSVAALAVAAIGLLFVRVPWSVRLLQATLLLGVIEWLRTAWVFASARAQFGQPYGRLLLILGAVAALTGLAAWLLGRASWPVRTPGD